MKQFIILASIQLVEGKVICHQKGGEMVFRGAEERTREIAGAAAARF